MGIQINGQTDIISATDGGLTVSGNLIGTASTATAAATAYGISGSATLSGITSISTINLTVNGNAYPSAGPLSNRNLIINGAMQVAQRGTQVTGVTTGDYRTCDRFRFAMASLGTWTVDQDTNAPNGFSNSFKVTCTTANASPAASNNLFITHPIEAYNLQSLGFGTAGAKGLTLSFWVRSNKTGAATVALLQTDNSNKLVSFEYSISSADTWEQKVITIPGDTAGVINNDNGAGLQFEWWLNSGSNYTSGSHQATWSTFSNTNRNPSNLGVGGATSDYFAITGVQLEVGSVATPFERRSYGAELALCQRYYQIITTGNGFTRVVSGPSKNWIYGQPMIQMRSAPSVSADITGTNANRTYVFDDGQTGHTVNSGQNLVLSDAGANTNSSYYVSFQSSIVGYNGLRQPLAMTTGVIFLSSEL